MMKVTYNKFSQIARLVYELMCSSYVFPSTEFLTANKIKIKIFIFLFHCNSLLKRGEKHFKCS